MTVEQDLFAKTAVVTGATGGIGRAMTLALAARGARVIAIGRNPSKAAALRDEIRAVGGDGLSVVLLTDFSTRAGIADAAANIRAQATSVDVLINNAGAHFSDRHLSADGLEMHVAVDYLPAYGLMALLEREIVSGSARVVNVVSDTLRDARRIPLVGRARPPKLELCDLRDLRTLNSGAGYDAFDAYARAKLLTAVAGNHFARRWEAAGVTVNAVHPGIVATGIVDDLIPVLLRPLRSAILARMLTAEEGASAALRLVADPELFGISGRYFVRETETDLPPIASDPAAQGLLSETSERFLRGR